MRLLITLVIGFVLLFQKESCDKPGCPHQTAIL